jgi:hypothetical protein
MTKTHSNSQQFSSRNIRRHPDGSIDFAFYRRMASRRRRLAKRVVFKRYRTTISKAAKASVSVVSSLLTLPSLRDRDRRPILRASAIATVLLAVAAFHTWAQGDHARSFPPVQDRIPYPSGH